MKSNGKKKNEKKSDVFISKIMKVKKLYKQIYVYVYIYIQPNSTQKTFNIISHQINANQSHNEILLHTHYQDGYNQRHLTC